MEEIIHNNDNLKESDVTELVIRCKGLIINNGYLFLGNEDGTLQFPGGHLEEEETLLECLKREVKEETGIVLSDDEISKPFLKAIFLNKDWPEVGKNRKCEIYYYAINTNKDIDLSNTEYTDGELEKHFKIDKVLLSDSISYIEKNIPKNEHNKVIAPDMIKAINEYLKIKNIVIRKVKENDYSDLKILMQYIQDLHYLNRSDIHKHNEIFSKDEFNENFDNILVAEIKGTLCGIAIYFIKNTKDNNYVHGKKVLFVEWLAVKPKYRKKGVASLLMDKMQEIAKENKCSSIELNVWSFNKGAIKFYEKMNMKVKTIIYEKRI